MTSEEADRTTEDRYSSFAKRMLRQRKRLRIHRCSPVPRGIGVFKLQLCFARKDREGRAPFPPSPEFDPPPSPKFKPSLTANEVPCYVSCCNVFIMKLGENIKMLQFE